MKKLVCSAVKIVLACMGAMQTLGNVSLQVDAMELIHEDYNLGTWLLRNVGRTVVVMYFFLHSQSAHLHECQQNATKVPFAADEIKVGKSM